MAHVLLCCLSRSAHAAVDVFVVVVGIPEVKLGLELKGLWCSFSFSKC